MISLLKRQQISVEGGIQHEELWQLPVYKENLTGNAFSTFSGQWTSVYDWTSVLLIEAIRHNSLGLSAPHVWSSEIDSYDFASGPESPSVLSQFGGNSIYFMEGLRRDFIAEEGCYSGTFCEHWKSPSRDYYQTLTKACVYDILQLPGNTILVLLNRRLTYSVLQQIVNMAAVFHAIAPTYIQEHLDPFKIIASFPRYLADVPAADREALKTALIALISDSEEWKIDWDTRLKEIALASITRNLEHLQNEIGYKQANMREFLEKIGSLRKEIERMQVEYAAYKAAPTETLLSRIEGITEYLGTSRGITDWWIDGSNILFTIVSPLRFSDPDEIEDRLPVYFSAAQQKIIRKVLEDEILIYLESTLTLDIEDGRIYCDYRNQENRSEHHIPNPHLIGYNCFGGHTQLIAESISRGDYIGALEQAIEANSFVNSYDTPVIEKLSVYLSTAANLNQKIINEGGTWFEVLDYTEA